MHSDFLPHFINIPEQVGFIHLKQTREIIIKFLQDGIHYCFAQEARLILYPVTLAVDIQCSHLPAVEHQGKSVAPF